jgi:DNA-3-methyladenine glycosylase II
MLTKSKLAQGVADLASRDGDLALAKAAQQVKGLEELPDQDQLEELAESWQPWRAVAARVLWHHYLSRD